MSDTIYLVVGAAGCYSDSRTWTLAWYVRAADAHAHAEAAMAEASVIRARYETEDEDFDKPCGWRDALAKTAIDPLRDSYDIGDGLAYSVVAIERGKWPFALPSKRKEPR